MKLMIFVSKIYVIVALLFAAILSPSNFSIIPIALLALYIFQWHRVFSHLIDVLTQYFMFFAVTLLFTTLIPEYYAPLAALPVLPIINQSMLKYSNALKSYRPHNKRRPTTLYMAL